MVRRFAVLSYNAMVAQGRSLSFRGDIVSPPGHGGVLGFLGVRYLVCWLTAQWVQSTGLYGSPVYKESPFLV